LREKAEALLCAGAALAAFFGDFGDAGDREGSGPVEASGLRDTPPESLRPLGAESCCRVEPDFLAGGAKGQLSASLSELDEEPPLRPLVKSDVPVVVDGSVPLLLPASEPLPTPVPRGRAFARLPASPRRELAGGAALRQSSGGAVSEGGPGYSGPGPLTLSPKYDSAIKNGIE
jgi:hypothetical protein